MNAVWHEEDWPNDATTTGPGKACDRQPMSIIDMIGGAIRRRIDHGLAIFDERSGQEQRVLQLPMSGAMAMYEGVVTRVLATTHGANNHPFDFVTLNRPQIQSELRMARCVTPTLEILDDEIENPAGNKSPPKRGPHTPPGSPPQSPEYTPNRGTFHTPPNVDTDETIWSGDEEDILWRTIDEWDGESQQLE